MDWKGIFEGTKELPFWAFAIRATLLYFALIIVTRFMGKRQVGILSGHNYLVAAGIVSLAAVRMVNPEASLTSGLVIVFVYAGMNILWSYLDLKWPNAIDRKPIILVKNGQVIKQNLHRSMVTIDNLLGQLRLKGAANLSEVAQATLEPTGKISILKKPETVPVNQSQMGLPAKFVTQPTILVYDGQIDYANLSGLGYTENWLEEQLRKQGILKVKDVFLALLEPGGNLSVSV
ncbi:MAG: DUF421 domain-containing protein [Clostridia bacterium]|nr:DUF421 domain-containing protein [Clostridia bacterium]